MPNIDPCFRCNPRCGGNDPETHHALAALAKLETGQRANPTVETQVCYAEAVGKRLVVSLAEE